MKEPTIPAAAAERQCKEEARLTILQFENGRYLARFPGIPQHWTQERVREFLTNELLKQRPICASWVDGSESNQITFEVIARVIDDTE